MIIHDVFAYLRVRGAARAIAFYGEAFGARERFRLVEPGGRVGHAELQLGGSTVLLSDEYPEAGIFGPQSVAGTTFSIHLHLDDADAAAARAVRAGATLVRPPETHFYGERSATVRDPFGHEWVLGHSVEEIAPEEMQRRYDALFREQG